MKIAPDVHKISGFANTYVVLSPIPTIIDTGDFGDRALIKSEIEKIIPLGDIRQVVLTHLHYDHCGNSDLFGNAKIYASKEEVTDFKKNPEIFFADHMDETNLNFLINRLEIIPENLKGFKILNVPGHTRGSISLLDEKRKLLFSGDTIFRNGIGRTDFENSVPEKMEESLHTLLSLIQNKNLTLCAGHNY